MQGRVSSVWRIRVKSSAVGVLFADQFPSALQRLGAEDDAAPVQSFVVSGTSASRPYAPQKAIAPAAAADAMDM